MKNFIYLLSVVFLFWSQILVAQRPNWSECEGSYLPNEANLSQSQKDQIRGGVSPNQVWPPLTSNHYEFVYKNGSSCFIAPPAGVSIADGNGYVVSQGATAYCWSSSIGLSAQCIPNAPNPNALNYFR